MRNKPLKRTPIRTIAALLCIVAAGIAVVLVLLGARLENLAAGLGFMTAAFHIFFYPPPEANLSRRIAAAALAIACGAILVVAYYLSALEYVEAAFVLGTIVILVRDAIGLLRTSPV